VFHRIQQNSDEREKITTDSVECTPALSPFTCHRHHSNCSFVRLLVCSMSTACSRQRTIAVERRRREAPRRAMKSFVTRLAPCCLSLEIVTRPTMSNCSLRQASPVGHVQLEQCLSCGSFHVFFACQRSTTSLSVDQWRTIEGDQRLINGHVQHRHRRSMCHRIIAVTTRDPCVCVCVCVSTSTGNGTRKNKIRHET
jgi:hypothetical protein